MGTTVAPNAVAAVSEARQWDRLMELAKLGAITGADGSPGVNRQALTPLDRVARRLVIGWGEAIGLTASVDALGNLFLRHEGTEAGAAPVLSGSHMDSQPAGGRFDGIWGVIAALEAVQALREAGVATKPPDRGRRLDQRGRQPLRPGLHGQHGLCRAQRARDLGRRDGWRGHPLRRRIARAAGKRSGPAAPRPRRSSRPHAYVEAHIEQGPILEDEGIDIGIVTGIQGSRWFLVELTGESAHAGTSPVSTRRDAVQDMVRAITALNALMADPTDVLRFTVARIEVAPNSPPTASPRPSASPSTSATPTPRC